MTRGCNNICLDYLRVVFRGQNFTLWQGQVEARRTGLARPGRGGENRAGKAR